jgi:hypothetical protein
MAYKVKFPKKSFFYPLQKGMNLDIVVDSEMRSLGSFGYSYERPQAVMRVKSISAWGTYMHEFVHACQVFSSTSPGRERFRFNRKSLKKYVLSRGLYFDEDYAEYIETFLQEAIADGLYTSEEFSFEFPAYYVSEAVGGEAVLEAFWVDAQKFMKRRDSFWTHVQKNSRTKWKKKHLIHLVVPAYLILLMFVSFVTRPNDKPLFRPWVRDLINHVIQN